ncbi:MAG: hypothetical protein B5M56_02705 [Desulfococcus sp. 4484_241]|nr:MAG: hypothetical protein B5M56_02705 [Desulfococcus sp. 4484_241]
MAQKPAGLGTNLYIFEEDNTMYRRIILLIITAVILIPASTDYCMAERLSFDIGVSSDDIHADGLVEMYRGGSTIYAGIGGMYMEDDYTLYYLKGGLKQNVLSRAVTVGLGLKALTGEAKKVFFNRDYDLSVIGFNVTGSLDLSETAANVPVTLFADITAAPDPLCFVDCTQYIQYVAGLEFNIIKNGSVVAQYMKIDTDLEEGPFELNKSDDSVYIGFKLRLGI